MVATWAGASEPPLLFSTTTSLPVETNEYLPSGVTATPKGLPPTDTSWLCTTDKVLALPVDVVHGGGLTAATTRPVPLPLPPPPVPVPVPVPPWCSAVKATTPTATTTTAATLDMKA